MTIAAAGSRHGLSLGSQLAAGRLRKWSCPAILQARWKHDESSQPTVKRTRFSIEDTETIFREKKAGKTFEEIASHLGRCSSSIKTHYYQGIDKRGGADIRSKRKLTDRDIELITKLRGENQAWPAIGKLFGRTHNALRASYIHHTQEQGLENYMAFGTRWPLPMVEKLLHMRDDLGMPFPGIAQELGKTLSSTTTRYYREKYMQPAGPQRWSFEEDQTLFVLRDEQSLSWKHISQELPMRTAMACRLRHRFKVAASPSQSRHFSTLVPADRRSTSSYVHLAPVFVTFGRASRPTLEHRVVDQFNRWVQTEARAQPARKPFTKEEDKIILQRRREQCSFFDIATELGRISPASVRERFYRVYAHSEGKNLINRINPLSSAEFEEIARQRAAGVEWRALSQQYGRKSTHSLRLAFRNYLQTKRQPHLQNLPWRAWSEAEVVQLVDCRDRLHQQWHEIAARLQRSDKAVQTKYMTTKMQGQVGRPTTKDAYTVEEDILIFYLRDFLILPWRQIQLHFPSRTFNGLEAHYYYRHGKDKLMITPDKAPEHFTPNEYALLHDLRSKQQLPWEAVEAEMPRWTIKDLQDRHALLVKWPPSSTPSSAKAKGSREFTTVTESSLHYSRAFGRTLWTPQRPGTFWTTSAALPKVASKPCHVSRRLRQPTSPERLPVDMTDRDMSHLVSFASSPNIAMCQSNVDLKRRVRIGQIRRKAIRLWSHVVPFRSRSPVSDFGQLRLRHPGMLIAGVWSCQSAIPVSLPASVARYSTTQGPERLRRKRFSGAEIDWMLTTYKEGKSYENIARELGGRAHSSVWGVIQRWLVRTGQEHLIRRKKDVAADYDHQAVKAMRASGMNWDQIGARFGWPQSAICRYYSDREAGYGPTKAHRSGEPFSETEVQTLLHLRNVLGQSWTQIAHHMGRTPKAVDVKFFRVRREMSMDLAASTYSRYSPDELQLLEHLRRERKLPWKEVQEMMPKRAMKSLKTRYYRIVAEKEFALQKSGNPGTDSGEQPN